MSAVKCACEVFAKRESVFQYRGLPSEAIPNGKIQSCPGILKLTLMIQIYEGKSSRYISAPVPDTYG